LKRCSILFVVSTLLIALAAGSGTAQYANMRVDNASGVYGEVVDVAINLQHSELLGSISLGLDFDTGMFQIVDVQNTGPFAEICDVAPVVTQTGTGVNITALETCDPVDIGLISPYPAVFIVSFEVVGTDTGEYTLSIPNSYGVADPVPLFEPDGTPFLFVGVQNGTFDVLPTKLGVSSGTAAQGSKGTIIDLNLDIGTPDGVAALQFDLLFDTDALSVAAIEKGQRATGMSVWNFSRISGGIRLLASLAGNPGEQPIGQGSGAIGQIYVDVNQGALDQDYTLTFGGVTMGDPNGNELDAKIVGGSFTVIKPSAVLTVGEGAGHPGTSGTVPVSLYLTEDISSVQFDVAFSTNDLTLSGVSGYGMGQGCSFSVNGNTISGNCALSAGAGPILELTVDAAADADEGSYTLTVSNVQVVNGGSALPTGAENGQFNVVSEGSAVATVVNSAAMVGATDNVVSVSLLNVADVSGFQMDLLFDTQYITITDVSLTDRSSAMTLSQYTDANGLRAIFYSDAGALVAAGAGPVFDITFDVANNASEGSYPLSLSGVVVGDVTGAEMETEVINGALWVTCGAMGDVNSDYAFNITDVVALINIIIQKVEVDDCTTWKGDFNGDGQLNVLDAVAMVYAILGGSMKTAFPGAEAVVSADQIIVSESRLELPISIESQAEIYGAQVTVKYDAQTLTPGTPQCAGRSVASRAANGELTMLICSTDGNPLVLDNIAVPFEVTGAVKGLAFGEVILAGYNGQPIAADIEAITLRSDLVPQEFALGQNYPNPFNPETQIAFNLPQNSEVELSIYNVLGQKIATLINTEMAAGQHVMTWSADTMPTGVYFYTINAGEYTATKRMVLLK
jgi:hypothetical protein